MKPHFEINEGFFEAINTDFSRMKANMNPVQQQGYNPR